MCIVSKNCNYYTIISAENQLFFAFFEPKIANSPFCTNLIFPPFNFLVISHNINFSTSESLIFPLQTLIPETFPPQLFPPTDPASSIRTCRVPDFVRRTQSHFCICRQLADTFASFVFSSCICAASILCNPAAEVSTAPSGPAGCNTARVFRLCKESNEKTAEQLHLLINRPRAADVFRPGAGAQYDGFPDLLEAGTNRDSHPAQMHTDQRTSNVNARVRGDGLHRNRS